MRNKYKSIRYYDFVRWSIVRMDVHRRHKFIFAMEEICNLVFFIPVSMIAGLYQYMSLTVSRVSNKSVNSQVLHAI
jgi:hypothetical protein